MTTKLITAPTTEPIDLAYAKLQCRIDDSTVDDSLINSYIAAAREEAEHETGRALLTQTRELVIDGFFQDSAVFKSFSAIELHGSPLQSVTSVKYFDESGILQTLDPSNYVVDIDSEPGIIRPALGKSWPATLAAPNAVRIRYVCGNISASAVPQGIKQWIAIVVATLFANRESLVDGRIIQMPGRTWERLLDPYRLYGGL